MVFTEIRMDVLIENRIKYKIEKLIEGLLNEKGILPLLYHMSKLP